MILYLERKQVFAVSTCWNSVYQIWYQNMSYPMVVDPSWCNIYPSTAMSPTLINHIIYRYISNLFHLMEDCKTIHNFGILAPLVQRSKACLNLQLGAIKQDPSSEKMIWRSLKSFWLIFSLFDLKVDLKIVLHSNVLTWVILIQNFNFLILFDDLIRKFD